MADKHGAGQTMAQSIAMAGKHVAEELRLCVEENNSTWSNVSSFLTNDAGGAFLLTAMCMIALPWIWLQSLKWFLYILMTLNVKQGQERLKQAISRDGTLKDLIEKLETEMREEEDEEEEEEDEEKKDEKKEEIKMEEKKEERQELNHTHCTDHSEKSSSSGPKAPVFITVPTSKGIENKFEHLTRKKLEADRFKGRGFYVFQARVELSPEGMERLYDLADEGTKSDKKFTVQLSRWRILVRTAGEQLSKFLNRLSL